MLRLRGLQVAAAAAAAAAAAGSHPLGVSGVALGKSAARFDTFRPRREDQELQRRRISVTVYEDAHPQLTHQCLAVASHPGSQAGVHTSLLHSTGPRPTSSMSMKPSHLCEALYF